MFLAGAAVMAIGSVLFFFSGDFYGNAIDSRARTFDDSSIAQSPSSKDFPAGMAQASDSPPSPFAGGSPSSNHTNEYWQLAEAADSGDGDAAYKLARTIANCSALPRTEEGLAEERERAMASISQASSEEELQVNESVAAHLSSRYERCSEFGWKDDAERAHWTRVAAELGNSRAQIEFVAEQLLYLENSGDLIRDPLAVEKWKADSRRFLMSALQSGEIDAAFQIAHAYQEGTVFDKSLSRAYSHYYVTALAHPGAFDHFLESVGSQLSAMQLAEAQERGERIYENCCMN